MTIAPGPAPWKNPLAYALEKALASGPAAAARIIDTHTRSHPGASPADIQKLVDRWYVGSAAACGGAAGAAAAVPGMGIPVAMADAGVFVTASVTYVMTSAALAGDTLDDPDRLRLLALAALVGNSATGIIHACAKRTGAHVGGMAARAVPLEAIKMANKILGRHFVTRYGTKQGILVLGKALPAGVGCVLGSGGNFALSHATVRATRKLVGRPLDDWENCTFRTCVGGQVGEAA